MWGIGWTRDEQTPPRMLLGQRYSRGVCTTRLGTEVSNASQHLPICIHEIQACSGYRRMGMLDQRLHDPRGPTHGASRIGRTRRCARDGSEASLSLLPTAFLSYIATECHRTKQLARSIDHGRSIPGNQALSPIRATMHNGDVVDSSVLMERAWQRQFVRRKGCGGAIPEKSATDDPWRWWAGKVPASAWPAQHAGTGRTHICNVHVAVAGADECGQVINCGLPASSMRIRGILSDANLVMETRRLDGERGLDCKELDMFKVFCIESFRIMCLT